MTAPHSRDPRLRRGQPADPLAAAVRLSMSADAMRVQQLATGPETIAAEHIAAAVQLGTVEPPLSALEFAAALDAGRGVLDIDSTANALVAESPAPPPAESLPPAPPASAPAAFDSERSRPRSTWRSRHDERSLGYGVRRPGGLVTGSTPLQEVLLPAGPVLDQLTAGATLAEQSCCTGAGTVAAVNTLRLLAGDRSALTITDAEAIYRLGQQRDEQPGEDYAGTSVTGAMQAAVELGVIGGYLWCFGTRDIAQTILARRPVVVGIPWPSGMWDTGPGGLVVVQGDDQGLGHCLTVNGITLKGPQGQPGPFFRWQQSAGESYGVGGFGFIHHRDLAALLHGRGEAAVPTLEAQQAAA